MTPSPRVHTVGAPSLSVDLGPCAHTASVHGGWRMNGGPGLQMGWGSGLWVHLPQFIPSWTGSMVSEPWCHGAAVGTAVCSGWWCLDSGAEDSLFSPPPAITLREAVPASLFRSLGWGCFHAGLCGRCTGVAVPLRVVPSPTGLPSKRGPGLGFSRLHLPVPDIPAPSGTLSAPSQSPQALPQLWVDFLNFPILSSSVFNLLLI